MNITSVSHFPLKLPLLLLFRHYRMACGGVLAQLLMAATMASAQTSPTHSENAVKAAFLYKFSEFTEWPPAAFDALEPSFVIGVYGNDDVAAELEKIVADRMVNGRPVVARYIRELEPHTNAHILFIANQRDNKFPDLPNLLLGPILVVTEQDIELPPGSVINFFIDQGRVRFAVSLPAAKKRSLKLSARLLGVAKKVEGHAR